MSVKHNELTGTELHVAKECGALAPSAQETPDMTLAVASAIVESYYQNFWNGRLIVDYAGGNSDAISAPSVNPRIDILYLTSEGALAWVTGDEAGSPVAKWASLPDDSIPICLVYCKTTMTKIVSYADRLTNASEGYIHRDIRPFFAVPSITVL